MRAVAEAARAYADDGWFTIVEGIVIPRWFLGPLRASLEGAGQKVAYAVLRAPLELCIARREQMPPGIVEGVWRQFEDLGELEPNAIDVTSASTEAVAGELADGLGRRFLLSP